TPVPGPLASAIVTLDLYAANVDRTARNPNLLWWRGELWLIDHGAALYWHHGWDGGGDLAADAARPFSRAREHVLLPFADELPGAGRALVAALDDETLSRAVASVPEAWLDGEPRLRAAYLTWLRARRAALPHILEEAQSVRAASRV
ncbi:MAG: hypothetical protein JWM82_921, partial [Myxococcales bacterium]|nr:hypothetical protein [Myxococcales bacterium]